jgi:hypothetical protein
MNEGVRVGEKVGERITAGDVTEKYDVLQVTPIAILPHGAPQGSVSCDAQPKSMRIETLHHVEEQGNVLFGR